MQTPGSKAPARHWVVGNIKGSDLRTGNLSTATTVSAYNPSDASRAAKIAALL